jgi:hypothetical protein
MPKLTSNFRDSQRFFLQNTVLPLIEENRRLPRQIRKSDSKMIQEIAYRYGHSSKQIYRLMDLYGKKPNPPHTLVQTSLFMQ